MDTLQIGGLEIAFEREGRGPALVLLHGGVSDSREWRRQFEGLSDAFTVVAWDAPGCGRSSDPLGSFSMSEYADCLAGFIDALGLGRPHVAGLSFGGTVALELFRRHPRVPRTLVLAPAYTGWAGSLPPETVTERLEGVIRDSQLSAGEFAARWLPTLFSDDAPRPLRDELGAIIADFHPHGVRAMARAMAEADLRDVLRQIDVPTLLLYGERDVRSPLSIAEDLHSRIRDSTLVVLPGVGHQINMEAADQFNATLREFLVRHEPAQTISC
jgi:pimeloyl-ACP methyl ester carboxylesterase